MVISLQQIHRAVSANSRTPQQESRYMAACQTAGISEVKLQNDVITRWNSTYGKIKRAIQQKKVS